MDTSAFVGVLENRRWWNPAGTQLEEGPFEKVDPIPRWKAHQLWS